MSDNITCSVCGAPANVHLTQIGDNQVKKVHYCESCAAKQGALAGAIGFILPLAQALAAATLSAVASGKTGKLKACPTCGFTAIDFAKQHLLGCPDCYKTFAEELGAMLEKIQPGKKHTGKAPVGKIRAESLREAIATARESMLIAIKKEAYEDAAKLRDEIRGMEAQLETATA
ncbi:MAG: UvrB/UvrC motif-containing protein [Puniceicoccales bacterium]|jgi:protein arginine kinase activator|nr:UvrB/UvrC motif-containing protein [Puniceicoccales bacterium]